MVFFLGFILGMGGLALLIMGEAPWFHGQKVPAATARRVGVILVCFFPVAILVYYLVGRFEGGYDINRTIIYWVVAILWIALAGFVLYKGLPAAEHEPAHHSAVEVPFETTAVDEPMPTSQEPPPQPRKKARPQPNPKDPFDFN
jgi:hypothetical protein